MEQPNSQKKCGTNWPCFRLYFCSRIVPNDKFPLIYIIGNFENQKHYYQQNNICFNPLMQVLHVGVGDAEPLITIQMEYIIFADFLLGD